MKNTTTHHSHWVGQAAIGFGIGAFLGQSGHNDIHHHYAHQITMPLDRMQQVQVISEGQCYAAEILFIPAHVKHQLMLGDYLSIYLDTHHALAVQLQTQFAIPTQVSTIPIELQQHLHQSFTSTSTLDQGLIHFLNHMQIKKTSQTHHRLEQVLNVLYQGILQSDIPDRQSLAHIVGLSESRFSHWFREQTGLPLRSYRKWLRLICGLTQMQTGHALTDIAHQAQFADQAHFTRTCIELFGVRPSELRHIQGKIFFIPSQL